MLADHPAGSANLQHHSPDDLTTPALFFQGQHLQYQNKHVDHFFLLCIWLQNNKAVETVPLFTPRGNPHLQVRAAGTAEFWKLVGSSSNPPGLVCELKGVTSCFKERSPF